jgi:hypothetical protein
MLTTTMRGLAGAVALLLAGAGAQAHVLDKKADKAAFTLRADVAKQTARYTKCLAKAAAKCEAKGLLSSRECDVVTGALAYEVSPGPETAKFQAALAKCDDKLNLTKKGTLYTEIGCPGDCNSGVAGTQQCADLPAYEAVAAAGLRAHLNTRANILDAACAGEGTPDSEARIDCVAEALAQLAKYGDGLAKCLRKCETDDKGTKGGGAVTNAAVCGVPGGSAEVLACEAKAAGKVTNTAALAALAFVTQATGSGSAALFNRQDVTDPDSPAGTLSPCGTCGNNAREGTEVCDGTALGTCDVCAADCTCAPAVCGNDILESGETCDGTALGSCLVCDTNCECAPPECGNDIIEGAEACDGTALGSCDACDANCECAPLAVCGNNVIEGTEACDGTALGSCDACDSNCECAPAVCGNDVIEGTEECDGATLGACSLCASDCGCAEDPILDGVAGTFCTTALSTATTDYQPLCVPAAGSGRHFRIEGAQTSANNVFFYLAMGFPSMPTGNPATTTGDGRFIFTGGKSVSCAFAWTYFRYSGITMPAANPCSAPPIFTEYPNGPQTVCLDVSASAPPRVTFWATGANGANCKDKSTLTALTALYSKDDWTGTEPVNESTHFAKLNNTSGVAFTSMAVSSNTVLP